MKMKDMSIDLSDIPEITDFSKARKNPYAEKLLKHGYSIVINVSPEDIANMMRNNIEKIQGMNMLELDPYEQRALEKYTESALVRNLKAFLSETGDDFVSIDTQYPMIADNTDFYVDLLLFHRRLKCLVAIELKIGEFKPEYTGKMQSYLTALDEMKKLPAENPSVGIIICKSKRRTIVEYVLKSADKPIGGATYNIYNTVPDSLKDLLPEPDEIASRLEILDEIP